MEELLKKLKENNLIDEMGNIVLEKINGQTIAIDVQTFNVFFGDKLFTYKDMIGVHIFTWNEETLTKSGEELGYKKYLDKWKELGILE